MNIGLNGKTALVTGSTAGDFPEKCVSIAIS